mmetsp:Transcript_2159/g.6441  ORF Transcript_2159/g.6441 Transcript_2159/m.6441 type:complete len:412 (+) Transcript_2159:461-1696(+)
MPKSEQLHGATPVLLEQLQLVHEFFQHGRQVRCPLQLRGQVRHQQLAPQLGEALVVELAFRGLALQLLALLDRANDGERAPLVDPLEVVARLHPRCARVRGQQIEHRIEALLHGDQGLERRAIHCQQGELAQEGENAIVLLPVQRLGEEGPRLLQRGDRGEDHRVIGVRPAQRNQAVEILGRRVLEQPGQRVLVLRKLERVILHGFAQLVDGRAEGPDSVEHAPEGVLQVVPVSERTDHLLELLRARVGAVLLEDRGKRVPQLLHRGRPVAELRRQARGLGRCERLRRPGRARLGRRGALQPLELKLDAAPLKVDAPLDVLQQRRTLLEAQRQGLPRLPGLWDHLVHHRLLRERALRRFRRLRCVLPNFQEDVALPERPEPGEVLADGEFLELLDRLLKRHCLLIFLHVAD